MGSVQDGSGNETQPSTNRLFTLPTAIETPSLLRCDTMDDNRRLSLLDLPVDVLQQIIAQTTHTNDLCALALTHSSLHGLVTPYIYSRFDIVWPEASPAAENRVGVDALTYGLSTLVMAHDVFGEVPTPRCQSCHHCNENRILRAPLQSRALPTQIRRGNYFANYTKKFSLGNGPTDWVSEYSITKEGGKMLGTLVALALGRMRNLEAFVWDMPTGVLRDVWIALASLATRDPGQACRLEKIWVRWHDNSDVSHLPHDARLHTLPSMMHGTASSLFYIPPYPTVEFPTFSILPSLKSITVLDIDEVSYVEELSLLIERSLDKLQELRIGVAHHVHHRTPFRPGNDRPVFIPGMTPCEQNPNPYGILGTLMGRFCQPPAASHLGSTPLPRTYPQGVSSAPVEQLGLKSYFKDGPDPQGPMPSDVDLLGAALEVQSLQDDPEGVPLNPSRPLLPSVAAMSTPRCAETPRSASFDQSTREPARKRLKLATFELERVHLSIPILSKSLDWTRLESLTLLGCTNHEELWNALRNAYTPPSLRHRTPGSRLGSSTRNRYSSSSYNLTDPSEYRLRIRRLHTDTVSRALLDFIKTSLAPDTLEWLFLQRTSSYESMVKVEDIYRSVIRRHKPSLRKLLIDGEYRNLNRNSERDRPEREYWREWMFHEELITCITSGKMQLRELSMSIDHKNWQYFLQRLPNLTSLRSLHLSRFANHTNRRDYDREEVAHSILNIIAVRPEIELCYFGIERKCYEVLEYNSKYVRPLSPTRNYVVNMNATAQPMPEDEDEDEDHDDGGAAHHINQFVPAELSEDEDQDETQSNFSSRSVDTEDDEDDSNGLPSKLDPSFRLREILFYDDKISIFKARHGKL